MTINLCNAALYYKELEHQKEAWDWLQGELSPTQLETFAKFYRTAPEPTGEVDNTWAGIEQAAYLAGAKFPECVAAQWALESGWGKHTSGKNNFFGIKGPGTTCTTWEDYGNGPVIIQDSFKDYASIQECIDDLVNKWYKDYRGYQGVNRASNREECAALLKAEGYATDPAYVQKLISLMNQYS